MIKDENDSLEARTWLKANSNKSALATNRFGSSVKALEFVQKLYEAGAIEVLVDKIYSEEWRILEEGGPYSDSLKVLLPDNIEKQRKIFQIYVAEHQWVGAEPASNDEKSVQEMLEFWNIEDPLVFWWD